MRSVRWLAGTDPYDSGVPDSHPGMPDATQDVRTVRLDWHTAGWIIAGVFSALVLVGFYRNVPDSLSRVGIGVLLAFALDPLVTRIRAGLGCSRAVAVAIVSATVVVIFATLLLVVGPPAIEQARRFGGELPETVEDLYEIPLLGSALEDRDAAEHVRQWAADLPARIDTETVTNTARAALDGVVASLVVLLVGLAVLVDGERLVRRLRAVIPDSIEPKATQIGRIFYRTIGAYFAGSLLVAALAAMYILVVGLIFGVPLVPVAAVWMLIVNLIPQVGGFLGGGFFVMLALSDGVETGLFCLAAYLVYQQVENHLIQPAIVGEAVDLSAPATMLAALVGAAAAGVPGAVVATPLVGAAKALYLELRYGEVPEAKRRHGSLWDRVRRKTG